MRAHAPRVPRSATGNAGGMRSQHAFPPRALALTGAATVIASGRLWVSLLTGSVGAVLTADLAALASTMQEAHFPPRPRLLQPRGLLSELLSGRADGARFRKAPQCVPRRSPRPERARILRVAHPYLFR